MGWGDLDSRSHASSGQETVGGCIGRENEGSTADAKDKLLALATRKQRATAAAIGVAGVDTARFSITI